MVSHLTGSSQNVEKSDEDIIREVQAGAKERFQLLVERHQQMLIAMIYRQVGDAHVASDLAQETLVKAYLGIKTFRFEAKWSTWLVRIALNQTNTYFSSKKYKQQLSQESFEVGKHEMSSEDREDQSMTEQKLKSFRKVLPTLKPIFREVVVLCGIEGKSYDEAASILEIPIGTIRSRLNTARLILRDAIAKELAGGQI